MPIKKSRIKPTEPQNHREARIRAAMEPLVGDPRFEVFIELLAELRDSAFANAVSDSVILSDRLTLAALGESRAYHDIIGIYENFHEQRENNLDSGQEA